MREKGGEKFRRLEGEAIRTRQRVHIEDSICEFCAVFLQRPRLCNLVVLFMAMVFTWDATAEHLWAIAGEMFVVEPLCAWESW